MQQNNSGKIIYDLDELHCGKFSKNQTKFKTNTLLQRIFSYKMLMILCLNLCLLSFISIISTQLCTNVSLHQYFVFHIFNIFNEQHVCALFIFCWILSSLSFSQIFFAFKFQHISIMHNVLNVPNNHLVITPPMLQQKINARIRKWNVDCQTQFVASIMKNCVMVFVIVNRMRTRKIAELWQQCRQHNQQGEFKFYH